MALRDEDDFFHPPATNERWWTETYWFSFDDPARNLSGTFYPLLRPNLGISALTVALWAPERSTAWTAPYYRAYWHLACPRFEGASMRLEGLRYDILEPLNAYRVRYEDEGVYAADLTVTGITSNHVVVASRAVGHWDQPSRVQGWLELAGKRIELDCFGMRDRSWGPRLDSNDARASYVYGINASGSFLVISQLTMDPPMSTGYVELDGERSRIAEVMSDIARDDRGRANVVRLQVTDEAGRRFDIRGRARNHLAKQASPGYFAWMSMFAWDFAGESYGEFQDVVSPDRLSAAAAIQLNL